MKAGLQWLLEIVHIVRSVPCSNEFMHCKPYSAGIVLLMAGCSVTGDLRLVDLCTLMKRFYSSSVSEDLGCRRGEFSRKHYGSVELVSLRSLSYDFSSL